MTAKFFTTAANFRAWLATHHAVERELLVGFHRKAAGQGITYDEALDAALAFGWIDGVRRQIDSGSYSIRFSPRKSGSNWSAKNLRRVRELIAEGRMEEPGLAAFSQRDEEKTKRHSYEREQAALDPVTEAKLRANSKAHTFFQAQPPGYRKLVTLWIMSAKKEETRASRLAILIEHCAAGMRIDLLKPRAMRPAPD